MKAMILDGLTRALRLMDVPVPVPAENEVLLKVLACGVCRTDLHVIEGDLPQSKIPLIPGHEIVGTVAAKGAKAERFLIGQRVGVPWLGGTCGRCKYCLSKRENLCDHARFTGYTVDGGYAEYAVADQSYCFVLPDCYTATEAAPLLCAGLIGYRALVAAGDAKRIGIYGFGAAAHILSQVARSQGREVYAFTQTGDTVSQDFARELGAVWAGGSTEAPPEEMDASILFAPVGALVPQALMHTAKGGTVVCAGIHMSDIPQFPYSILWGERTVRSVANLTRRDGEAFFPITAKAFVKTEVRTYPLEFANDALRELKKGNVRGAAVLVMDGGEG